MTGPERSGGAGHHEAQTEWDPRGGRYRGRHRGPTTSVGQRLGAACFVLLILAAGGALALVRPDAERRQRMFVEGGRVGEAIVARDLTLTVLGVRGGAALVVSRTAYDTTGVWLLVKVRTATTKKPTALGYAALRAHDGRVYEPADRGFTNQMQGRAVQPGIPVEGEFAFEVPRDVATDVTVMLTEASFTEFRRMDAMAEVRIRTDRATVDRWAAATEPVTLLLPQVVAP